MILDDDGLFFFFFKSNGTIQHPTLARVLSQYPPRWVLILMNEISSYAMNDDGTWHLNWKNWKDCLCHNLKKKKKVRWHLQGISFSFTWVRSLCWLVFFFPPGLCLSLLSDAVGSVTCRGQNESAAMWIFNKVTLSLYNRCLNKMEYQLKVLLLPFLIVRSSCFQYY